jgi:hypothetical protein
VLVNIPDHLPSEKHKVGELNTRIDEMMVYRNGQSSAEAKGQTHASKGDGSTKTGISLDHRRVDFQSNEEQKQAKADIRNEGQIRQ